MNNQTLIIAIFVVFLLVVVYFLWKLVASSDKLHLRIDEVEKEAKLAKTPDEILLVLHKLKSIDDDCWHKSYGARIRVVQAIIETKLTMMLDNHLTQE